MTETTDQQIKFVIGASVTNQLLKSVRALVSDLPEVRVEAMAVPSLTARKSLVVAPDLLVVEVRDDGSELLSIFPELHSRYPQLPVVALTTSAEHRTAVRLIQAGMKEYVVMTGEQHRLYDVIDRYLRERDSRMTQQVYLEAQSRVFDFRQIIGVSPALQNTLVLARKVADTAGLTVLILGETGTGKGLLAKAIHYNSVNREHPFVEIGCSSLPETLLESELFGHEKGAFTDARDRKVGLFELAGSGTIFLDEIGDISPSVQSKLLKVLEEKTMRRVGGVQDIKVNARIIAATSRDLSDLVRRGQFRMDLFYRLNVVPLVLPPLRDRREDIPQLMDHFLQHFGRLAGKTDLTLTPEARTMLISHAWEGNVRELIHALERAVVLSEDNEIGTENLDLTSRAPQHQHLQASLTESGGAVAGDDHHLTLRLPMRHATIAETEKHLVREVLRHVSGNKSRAAALLQISRPRLERILRQDREFFRDVLSK